MQQVKSLLDRQCIQGRRGQDFSALAEQARLCLMGCKTMSNDTCLSSNLSPKIWSYGPSELTGMQSVQCLAYRYVLANICSSSSSSSNVTLCRRYTAVTAVVLLLICSHYENPVLPVPSTVIALSGSNTQLVRSA